MPTTEHDRFFHFVDNREKYLLFVTTCSEKQETARHIGRQFQHLKPQPPALRVFQAGSGEGTLLNMVLRQLHYRWPTVPFLVAVKESSPEFIRMAVESLADRFREHPQLVLTFTNMLYSEAPWYRPAAPEMRARLQWRDVALTGNSAYGFDTQINAELSFVKESWQKVNSSTAGNPPYVDPSVLVLYRADQRFALDKIIPQPEQQEQAYDLVIASQPYRCRLSAESKVQNLLAPLALSLAPGGRMITIQSIGRDPGMEIIHAVWPGEDPFTTPRKMLLDTLRKHLKTKLPELIYLNPPSEESEFRYHLQLNPDEVDSSIGTSTLLAAWNAAAYVAQIEDERLTKAMSERRYLDVTRKVLQKHEGLWFNNESFVVARPHPD